MKVNQEGGSGPGTVVGVNVALTGTLKDQNDISVFGMVDGEVISEKSVMVGQTAQVKGPVKGALVTIAGTVRGAVEATEKLEVLETGKIYGSVMAKDLVVRSGAMLTGKIMMDSAEPEEAEVVPASPDSNEPTTNQETIPAPDEE